MPNNIIVSFAKKSGKAKEDVEKLWDKAKDVVKKEYPDIKEDSDKFYSLLVGVLKNMVGIKESRFDTIYEGIMGKALAGGLIAVSTAMNPISATAFTLGGPSVEHYQNNVTMNELIKALIQVESGGNTKAIGDSGNAKGQLQIWDVVVQDVNRVYKTNYTHDDAFHKIKSKDICIKYLTFWGKQYKKKTGNPPTAEVFARIFNGGPNGWKKKSTEKYWAKVQKELLK